MSHLYILNLVTVPRCASILEGGYIIYTAVVGGTGTCIQLYMYEHSSSVTLHTLADNRKSLYYTERFSSGRKFYITQTLRKPYINLLCRGNLCRACQVVYSNAREMLICAYPYHELIYSTPSRIEVDGTPRRVAMSNARDEALGASVALDGDKHTKRRGTLVTLLNYLDTAFRTNSTQHFNITCVTAVYTLSLDRQLCTAVLNLP